MSGGLDCVSIINGMWGDKHLTHTSHRKQKRLSEKGSGHEGGGESHHILRKGKCLDNKSRKPQAAQTFSFLGIELE